MRKVKLIFNDLLIKGGSLLVTCGMVAASLAANSACMFPFFEPEQPKELECLKKQ